MAQGNFLRTVIIGDWGLSNTFYIFGFLGFFGFGALKEFTQTQDDSVTIFGFIFALYCTFAAIAVCRAALKYNGSKIWKALAIPYAFILLGIQLPGFILMGVLGL